MCIRDRWDTARVKKCRRKPWFAWIRSVSYTHLDRYHIVRIERKPGEPIEAEVDEESLETDTEESSEIRGTIVTLYVEPITCLLYTSRCV